MQTHLLELYSLNLSDRVREMQNPFTGEIIHAPLDDGFTKQEQLKIERRMIELGDNQVDDDGFRAINLSSGQTVRFRDFGFPGIHPLTAIAVEYEGVDAELCELLFALIDEAFGSVRVGVSHVAVPNDRSLKVAQQRWSLVSMVKDSSSLRSWLEANKDKFD